MRVRNWVLVCACAVAAVPSVANGQCPDSALWSFPHAEAAVPADGPIVVKGMGSLGKQVGELARRRPSLRADGDHVPLVVISVTHRSAPGDDLSSPVTEAVLVPIRSLKPGLRYSLRLNDLDPKRGSPWSRLAWVAIPGPLAFVPEMVTGRPDVPAGCVAAFSNTDLIHAGAETQILRIPPDRQPSRWSIGYRVLAVIVFHCGVAVACAAWVAARGRRPKEAER